jgi:hypothetical protein
MAPSLSRTTGPATLAFTCLESDGHRRALSTDIVAPTGIATSHLSRNLHALGWSRPRASGPSADQRSALIPPRNT